MTDLSKRVLVVMTVLALLACGKKQEPASAPAPATAAQAPKPDPLKAAWVYVGPVADAGATFAHDQGRKAVETEFGDKVQTSFVERVPEGAAAEGVIRDLAAKGNKIIFATSIAFAKPMSKVAAEFPDVKFELASGFESADNVRMYDARSFESAYLAGVVAGTMTRTNTLGFVGSVAVPEVLRSINAFALGAQSVNARVRTKVAWAKAWFDPPAESAAAQQLVSSGADVLLQSTHSTAVMQVAEGSGKHAFGWASNMSAFAPKAHLASCVVDWGPYYKKAIKDVIDGSWTTGRTVWGLKEGQIAFVKMAESVPVETKERVHKLSAGLSDGSFTPYTGPVVDNTGKLRLAAGAVATQEWLDRIDFYVMGVEGKVPTGN